MEPLQNSWESDLALIISYVSLLFSILFIAGSIAYRKATTDKKIIILRILHQNSSFFMIFIILLMSLILYYFCRYGYKYDEKLINYLKYLPIVILLFASLFWLMIYSQSKLKNLTQEQEEKNTIEHKVSDFVEKVFSNKRFFTAFSTSLPQGKEDKNYGLDYIPFMLQNIENKRKRFKKYSDRFLTATISLGFIFILAVLFFSYVLLDDSAVGVGNKISQLNKEISLANSTIPKIKSSFKEQLVREQGVWLRRLKNDISELKDTLVKKGLIQIINKFESDDKFFEFRESLNALLENSENLKNEEQEVSSKIVEARNKIDDYFDSHELMQYRFSNAIEKMNQLEKEIIKEVQTDRNQLSEILKRMILSIVVISFFIAILRYVAKLYLSNYNQMILAEKDDLEIRKFYVALKNTDKNETERKIVIENFISRNSEKKDDDVGINLSKEETSLIKELLNGIAKKI